MIRHCLPAAALILLPAFASAQAPADLILIHGHILTVDAKDSETQAIATEAAAPLVMFSVMGLSLLS